MDFDKILSDAAGGKDRAAAQNAALAAAETNLRSEAAQLCRDAAAALRTAGISTLAVRTDHNRLVDQAMITDVWKLSAYGTDCALTTTGMLLDLHAPPLASPVQPRRRRWSFNASDSSAANSAGAELCACRDADLVMCPHGAWWFRTDDPDHHPIHLCWPSWDSDTGETECGTYFDEWLQGSVAHLGRR